MHSSGEVEWRPVEVLYPDDLAEAIFNFSEAAFERCMLGDVDPAVYWEHCADHCEWWQRHSMRHYEKPERLIPFSVYGDDVNTYRNSEIGTISIIAWTSDFAFKNTSLLRYWPICILAEHCMTDAWLVLL